MSALQKPRKHFWLIIMWALGYGVQERYRWYSDWVDCAHESNFSSGNFWGSPEWCDPDCQFRLKPNSKTQIRRHRQFWLILLWAIGFEMQEKYYWYQYWVNTYGTPDWSDANVNLRLKLFRRLKVK